jgi:hypothetical protein
MQCGPVRHRVSAKLQAGARPFSHSVIVRPTAFVSPRDRTPTNECSFRRCISNSSRMSVGTS